MLSLHVSVGVTNCVQLIPSLFHATFRIFSATPSVSSGGGARPRVVMHFVFLANWVSELHLRSFEGHRTEITLRLLSLGHEPLVTTVTFVEEWVVIVHGSVVQVHVPTHHLGVF